jgi:hypothetical protein
MGTGAPSGQSIVRSESIGMADDAGLDALAALSKGRNAA